MAVEARSRPALQSTPTLRQMADRARAANPATPDMIAAVLRDAIVSGVLAGGSQLRQSEVAAEFDVSVIPVREALRQLVAEGFVILHRNRGAIITETSVAEVQELFDLRASLEPMLLTHAFPHLRSADLDEAAAYQKALDDETDPNRWGHLNWMLHHTLYLPAGRARTLGIVANINRHIDRLLRVQMSLVDGKRKSRREHGAILQACRKQDLDGAVSLLVQHIRGVERIILAFASNQPSDDEEMES
jgi:DNA-binding GntR family transcriptional regulator